MEHIKLFEGHACSKGQVLEEVNQVSLSFTSQLWGICRIILVFQMTKATFRLVL